jgi:hypothetical protein
LKYPKNRKPRRKSKRGDAGKVPSNYARPIRWKLDIDYWDQLSPQETQQLAHFLDAFYGGDFRGRGGNDWAPGTRRQVWSDKRAALEDAYGQAEMYGAVAVLSEMGRAARDPTGPDLTDTDTATPDLQATPAYLNSDVYKSARDAYRATLATTRKPKAPVDTHRHRRTAKRLRVVTPDPPEPKDPLDPNGETEEPQS